jgi:hypothetical protein
MRDRRKKKEMRSMAHLWQSVDMTAGTDGCWPYMKKPMGSGYVKVYVVNNRYDYAHRIAYRLAYGEIPDGLRVLHTCDNRRCVNPAHLYLGTMSESQALSIQRGHRTFVHGDEHPSTKLPEMQVDAIRRRYAAGGVLQRDLADEYGVHYSLISLIVNGKRRHTA